MSLTPEEERIAAYYEERANGGPAEKRLVEVVRRLAGRVEELEKALRFQDPRNATERYDRIADDFQRAHPQYWAPGRSIPAAMNVVYTPMEEEERNRLWRKFVNEWHERWFDRALSQKPSGGEEVCKTCAEGSKRMAGRAAFSWKCHECGGRHFPQLARPTNSGGGDNG